MILKQGNEVMSRETLVPRVGWQEALQGNFVSMTATPQD